MLSSLSHFGRHLWLEVQLNPNPIIQKLIVHPIRDNKEWLRTLVQPTLPIVRYIGSNAAGDLTLTYVGSNATSRHLCRTMFKGEIETKQAGTFSVRQFPQPEQYPTAGDILALESDASVIRRLSWEKAIVMPASVMMVVDLDGTREEVEARFRRSNSARQEMRLTRKHGYVAEISHAEEDFAIFYEQMYRPMVAERHGRFGSMQTYDDVYAFFKRGLLLLVKRDEQLVAANLCYPDGDTLMLVFRGYLNATPQLLKEGVVGASDYLTFTWAHEQGYRAVNMMRCNPYADDGIFRYKRKWGARVIPAYDEQRLVWLKILKDTPAVRHYLLNHVPIIITKQGELQSTVITADEDISEKQRKKWHKKYDTPGLAQLNIRPLAEFLPMSSAVSHSKATSEVAW